MTNEQTIIHPFESRGFGKAPFKCVAVTKNVYSACPGHSQPGGTCDYCGTGIMYEFHIQSSDGRKFKVGSDCVEKTDKDLSRQVKTVRRNYRTPDQIQADQAEKDAKRAEWNREQDARQERLEQEMRQAEIANKDLIRVFGILAEGSRSQFISDMYGQLMTTPFQKFSPRQKDIICDIYAKHITGEKTHKGRKSNEYIDAYNEAWKAARSLDPSYQ